MKKTGYLFLLVLLFVSSFFQIYSIENEIEKIQEQQEDKEWYLYKEIASYTIDGVRESRKKKVSKVFNSYIGKFFTYDILSELQRDLYSLGYFQSIDPSVDKDEEGKLILIFSFKEIDSIENIKFVSSNPEQELYFSQKELLKVLPFSQNDIQTDSEIYASVNFLKEFYTERGRENTKINVEITDGIKEGCVNVTYLISEDIAKIVSEIKFESADSNELSFRTTILQNQISTKASSSIKSGFYVGSRLEEDRQKLISYYKKNGYKDVNITISDITIINTTSVDDFQRISIKFIIDEGKLWRFGSVQFVGNTIFDEKKLSEQFLFNIDDVFDNDKMRASVEAQLLLYYNVGYIFANIDARSEEDKENGIVNIIFSIYEGEKSHVEKIIFTGLVKTKEYVFKRELELKEGDVFSREKLQSSFKNIYNTGLIKNLNYNLTKGSQDNMLILEIIVEEGQQMDLSLGITFGGNDTGFPLSFLVSVNNKNLKGTGATFSTSVQVTTDYQALNLSIGSGWMKDVRWSNSISFSFERSIKDNILQKNPYSEYSVGRNKAFPFGYSSYEEFQAYDSAPPAYRFLMSYEMYRIAVSYGSGYTWMFKEGRLTLSGGLSIGLNHVTYDENEYTPFEYLIYEYRQGWRFSNRLSVSLTWDGRDFFDDTTKGYMLTQNLVYAGGFIGGLSNYIKTSTMASGYISILRTGRKDEIKPKTLVGSYTTTLSLVLPQYWNTKTDKENEGWAWHDAKYGATRTEMLYIDGMRVARGHKSVYDISFMWDNMVELSYPLVQNIVNAELFTSITGASKSLDNVSGNIVWYGAFGIGAKLKIPGFPLGFYFVADYKIKGDSVTWIDGGLFDYIHPVIAISTSLI